MSEQDIGVADIDLPGKEELPNPVPMILGVVMFVLLAVVGANVGLWWWAQQHAPAKPKKKMGSKQIKRETLKRGLALPQD